MGAGPRTIGVLERLGASAPELAPGLRLDIHVVDPHPAGGGRVWRREQSPLLWMNSVAEDITVFTDSSVTCDGPVHPGPSLAEWAAGEGLGRLREAGWYGPRESLQPNDFAPRGVQAEYLSWVWERVISSLPEGIRVHVHHESAVAVDDVRRRRAPERQRVTLASGRQLDADVVVLAQGYLDHEPTPEQTAWLEAAASQDLTYVPPGYTADLDLSGLRPSEPVIVRGMGLAFVDLFVLLAEGRGGRFTGEGLDLTYHPSGEEPVLYAGSRRGVPYHSKLGYSVGASGPVSTRHLTADALAGLGTLDFDSQVRPLVARELTDLHYRRLFAAHPERTRGSWQTLEALIAESDVAAPSFEAAAAAHVPDPHDRFHLPDVDRPMAGRTWGERQAYEQDLVTHIEQDIQRRASPEFSSDRAVFDGLLSVYGVLAGLASSGRLSPADRVLRLEQEFHGFFSFLASGPPPQRLAELLALHRAGIVRFLGPDVRVTLEDNGFRASSPSVRGVITARAFVDARLPRPNVVATTDPLIRGLLRRGDLSADVVSDGEDGQRGGQLLSDERCRAVRADGTSHPRRYLVGPSVSGSVGAGGFTRPGFNGAGLRQNDALARGLLEQLVADATAFAPSTTITTEEHRHAS
ncbi:FAD/NAD(P)-binding protein [Luteipulveratus mongoliensis]|uniref:FAD/NAD(P)-binding protein n=1 Tax=Luteipulveratus mongoliensis TaxID=571913 RepID=UPI001C54D476|nr:FAD/NAD(P)-binding protein [Luteipulveratus mongoliensis]